MAFGLPIQSTIRNVRRYQHVVRVLVRYGFAGFVHETGLDRLLERGLSYFTGDTSSSIENLSAAERVRRAMEELGPTFIKLGQILSTRRDLVPDDWAAEFSRLQDGVPAVDFSLVRARLEEEFGDKLGTIFKSIDPVPLAAASMAQVHCAELHDGTRVVLKILRPGIEDIVAADMEALRVIAGLVEDRIRNLGVSPRAVVDEFARQLERELDLTHEGRSTDRLRRAFEDDESVGFPEVHWIGTTRNILTLERIEQKTLSRINLDELSESDRKTAVASGARAVLRQCLEIGFFHADPHPGNLIVQPGGRVVFIDLGMTGQIEAETRRIIADLVYGASVGDVEAVARAALLLGDVDPIEVDERALRRDVQEIVGFFDDVPLERFNLSQLLELFFAALRRHHVRVPADLSLLIKALGSIEGSARLLDPDFDMVACARPYVEKILREQAGPAAIARRARNAAIAYAQFAETLPQEVGDLLKRLRRNRMSINLEHHGLATITTVIEHASRNIAFALVIAALVVASSILILAQGDRSGWIWSALGGTGFSLAGLIGLAQLRANRRFTRRNLQEDE